LSPTDTSRNPWDGLLLVDKPRGPTSQDLVSRARRLFQVKVGHTGTLDPLAGGLLPLLLGQATRLSRFYLRCDKEYLATVRLGETRSTFDGEGAVLERRLIPEITADRAEKVLERYRGEILQRPPMFSAVKIGGERLYKAARRDEDVERPLRKVAIHELELLERTFERWNLRIRCSSGTYIRTLAHEIGVDLGCGAYLEELRRTSVGDLHLDLALPLEKVRTEPHAAFLPLNELLPEFPALHMTSEESQRVLHGNPIPNREHLSGECCRLFSQDELVAIGRPTADGRLLQSMIVLSAGPDA